jgi:hypothetical protein
LNCDGASIQTFFNGVVLSLAARQYRRPVTINDLALSSERIEEMVMRSQVGRGKDNVSLIGMQPILSRNQGHLDIAWNRV